MIDPLRLRGRAQRLWTYQRRLGTRGSARFLFEFARLQLSRGDAVDAAASRVTPDALLDPFYGEFAGLYDEHSRGLEGDVEFYTRQALETDGLCLELGVGTGRIAIPSVAAGARVLGLDLSAEMLAICRRKASDAVLEGLAVMQGDMRRFALARPVRLVTIPYRSFLHNLTTEDQLSTLASCRAALEPGGRLVLNVLNPDLDNIGEWRRVTTDDLEERPGAGAPRLAYEGQRLESRMHVPDADGRMHRVPIRLRYVHRNELEHLLARAGFEVESIHGDFLGTPFGPNSTEIVCSARRL